MEPRIGDLTAPRPDAPILAFQPVRTYSQMAVAVASLPALDGHSDEAAVILIRLYTVARKLEPNGRTLVRVMIAKVMQKLARQTTGFVPDHAQISPASRAALAVEISVAAGGPAGVRRLILSGSGIGDEREDLRRETKPAEARSSATSSAAITRKTSVAAHRRHGHVRALQGGENLLGHRRLARSDAYTPQVVASARRKNATVG